MKLGTVLYFIILLGEREEHNVCCKILVEGYNIVQTTENLKIGTKIMKKGLNRDQNIENVLIIGTLPILGHTDKA